MFIVLDSDVIFKKCTICHVDAHSILLEFKFQYEDKHALNIVQINQLFVMITYLIKITTGIHNKARFKDQLTTYPRMLGKVDTSLSCVSQQ